jgi:ABC-2 type transport system ATP-binding protein
MSTIRAAIGAEGALSPAETDGITLQSLSKSYGDTRVLEGIDLHLSPGRIYGLLGANGVGKTTMMSVICNHTFRSGGRVLIDGEDPAENAPILARTCFVHEDQLYNDDYKLGDVLVAASHFWSEWDAELAAHLAERFRLPVRTKTKKMSRGQRSALAIVLSLSSHAPYTFLDEPYLGLDPTSRTIFYDELLRDYGDHPRTIVLSTHLIDEAADLMEEVIVLDRGGIALRADVDEARNRAFIARGLEDEVLALIGDRQVLSERRLGRILSATVRGTPSELDEEIAAAARISLEPPSLQELVAAIGIHDLDGDGGLGGVRSGDLSGDAVRDHERV